jgi:hypothetical protein
VIDTLLSAHAIPRPQLRADLEALSRGKGDGKAPDLGRDPLTAATKRVLNYTPEEADRLVNPRSGPSISCSPSCGSRTHRRRRS